MTISKKIFGKTEDGKDVYIFNLSNSKGMTAQITNLGGIVVSLKVPDKNNNFDDVVLGYDKFEKYLNNTTFFGAIIGRNANRIKNSVITINGKEYKLSKNEGENQLHGGVNGFDKALWKPQIIENNGVESLQLSYLSKDGEEGFPGNLNVKVTYTVTENNELKIDYYGISDKDTVVNLTNHSYFNLRGHSSGDVLDHMVMINADKFTPNDKESIPTGEIRDVEGTPMDLRKLTPIKERIDSKYEQIVLGNGYDHNFVLNKNNNELSKAAEVFEKNSGRVMEVYTTEPGVQFYTANFLDGTQVGKDGAKYDRRNALCLETQHFPDALNHKNFPSTILKAGDEYKSTTIYKFSTR